MKKISFIILFLFVIFVSSEKIFSVEKNNVKITILYDNYLFSERLKTDWGFSCFIEGTEKVILFDTGTNGDILFYNINKLKVNPKNVEYIVISHNHSDHTGGFFTFLEKNNKVTIFLPASSPQDTIKKIERTGAKVILVDKPREICKDVFLTGEMGTSVKEQSIILNTDNGLVIITGCAHPGIVDILERAKDIINKDIYLVFGGFHLLDKTENEINEIIGDFKKLKVLNLGATHCTGDKQIKMFKKAYGKNFVKFGVGKVLNVSNLY